jgi:hypothetical protein
MSTNVLEKPSVNYQEQLLQRAVVDSEFRSELMSNPEAFGLPTDSKNLVLPTPVAKQDMSFVELVGDDTGLIAPMAQCRSTCVSGWTIRCDGTTY